MTTTVRYCLDSSVLITAKRVWYARDIVPQFWTKIEEQIDAGTVYAPHAVYKELTELEDCGIRFCELEPEDLVP